MVEILITEKDDVYLIEIDGVNYYTGRPNSKVVKYDLSRRTSIKIKPTIEMMKEIREDYNGRDNQIIKKRL